jgi:cation diffusion facilitator CzcD-associated flavoprotein CzcO
VEQRVAIVGGGLAGFVAHATVAARARGPLAVTVFSASGSDPAAAWRRRAAAIRQRRMRSESDGHCLPTSFPGLAVRAAARRRSPWPLVRTVCGGYRPTVDEFLDHVEELRGRCGWDDVLVAARVERIRAVENGFELEGPDGRPLGAFRHVLVAPGHPGLNVPEELAGDPRAVHAYEPHDYADEVAVVGAGMAAATEWVNALAAGARVVSVRRREPARRPLNVPRRLFTRRGLARYHRLGPVDRAAFLRELLAPSFPPGRPWSDAVANPRFSVAAEVNGVEQVICATGFRRGFRHDPLLSRLVDEHGLATCERWIELDADCAVPALSDGGRTLALAGAPAQFAYPAADTLVGAKYAARGFLRRIESCRTR